jgi:hypothetical protein
MRRRTYQRIVRQIEHGEDHLNVVFEAGAQRFLGRLERSEQRNRRRASDGAVQGDDERGPRRTTMNALPPPAIAVPNCSYEQTRFNALHHGILSNAVLPWEDRVEYQTLLDALVGEHGPQGPTEEHLVEELAGVIWRKRRLQLAEAAVYRERLRMPKESPKG